MTWHESRVTKFCHGVHVQNRGVRDKSRDLGTLAKEAGLAFTSETAALLT